MEGFLMTEEEVFQYWFINEWKFGSSTDEERGRRAWDAARNAKIMPKELHEISIDPRREYEGKTGIYVRAKNSEGKWISTDIWALDRESLLCWLRSRGGVNEWAENALMLLLGHEVDP